MRVIIYQNQYKTEVFSSLAPFYRKYPEYLKHSSWIEKNMAKNQQYQKDDILLTRHEVIK